MLKENIHQVEQSNSEINTVSASTMPSEESAVWELSRRGLFTAAQLYGGWLRLPYWAA